MLNVGPVLLSLLYVGRKLTIARLTKRGYRRYTLVNIVSLVAKVLHRGRAPIYSNSVAISEQPTVTRCDIGNVQDEFWH